MDSALPPQMATRQHWLSYLLSKVKSILDDYALGSSHPPPLLFIHCDHDNAVQPRPHVRCRSSCQSPRGDADRNVVAAPCPAVGAQRTLGRNSDNRGRVEGPATRTASSSLRQCGNQENNRAAIEQASSADGRVAPRDRPLTRRRQRGGKEKPRQAAGSSRGEEPTAAACAPVNPDAGKDANPLLSPATVLQLLIATVNRSFYGHRGLRQTSEAVVQGRRPRSRGEIC